MISVLMYLVQTTSQQGIKFIQRKMEDLEIILYFKLIVTSIKAQAFYMQILWLDTIMSSEPTTFVQVYTSYNMQIFCIAFVSSISVH